MDEPISKSQKKRDANALQKIGIELIALNKDKLAQLPLTTPLQQAICEAKLLKSHGAQRRQAQLIGKLMRAADHEAILHAYQQLLAEDEAVTAHFHTIELWRNQLMNQEPHALTEFIARYQPSDIQLLRQLIKKAVMDKAQGKNTGAAKALFRYLKAHMQ